MSIGEFMSLPGRGCGVPLNEACDLVESVLSTEPVLVPELKARLDLLAWKGTAPWVDHTTALCAARVLVATGRAERVAPLGYRRLP